MKLHQWQTDTPDKTIRVGKIIGRWSKIAVKHKDIVIFLEGEMGSGKTTLANGIISGIGISGFAGSPSYTLVNRYEGNLTVNHIDLWRYKQYDKNMLWEEFSDYAVGAVTIIEWGNQLKELVDNYIEIKITGDRKRIVKLTAQ